MDSDDMILDDVINSSFPGFYKLVSKAVPYENSRF